MKVILKVVIDVPNGTKVDDPDWFLEDHMEDRDYVSVMDIID